jgi:hypothetical protein
MNLESHGKKIGGGSYPSLPIWWVLYTKQNSLYLCINKRNDIKQSTQWTSRIRQSVVWTLNMTNFRNCLILKQRKNSSLHFHPKVNHRNVLHTPFSYHGTPDPLLSRLLDGLMLTKLSHPHAHWRTAWGVQRDRRRLKALPHCTGKVAQTRPGDPPEGRSGGCRGYPAF